MKYVKEVTEYCFKNFWFVMLYAIIPIVFVGLLLHPFQFIEFLFTYPTVAPNFEGFSNFFHVIIPFDILTILMGVVAIVLCAVLLCMLLGRVERHFRTGQKNSEFNASDFNNNFLSVLFAIFFLFLSVFAIEIIATLLIMFFDFLFAKHGLVVLSSIFVCIIGILSFCLIAFLVLLFGVASADKMIMGSPFSSAIGTAFNAIKKNTAKILWATLLPFAFAIVLTLLGAWLNLVWLSNLLSLFVMIPYMCVLVMIVFFDYYDLPRYDTRPYYSLK